jgi:hypothetical protein
MGIKERITPVQVRQTVTFGQKLFFGQGGAFGKPSHPGLTSTFARGFISVALNRAPRPENIQPPEPLRATEIKPRAKVLLSPGCYIVGVNSERNPNGPIE